MLNVSCARMLLVVLALGGADAALAFNETLSNGTNRDLSVFAGDPTVDGLSDFSITGPASECGNITKFAHANSSARATPPGFNYDNMTYAEAIAQSYASTGPFCPSDGDLYYVKTAGDDTGTTVDDRFYKLRVNSNTSGGANVDYAYLGTGIPDPPDSSFTFTTYDLYGIFTDTSTGSPSAWAWSFGDSIGNSTQQHPRYRYLSAGNRTVTLTASNVGGADPTPAAQSVAVSERPSVSAAVGGNLDLDVNATADLQVVAGSGCDGGSSHLETRNGAGVEVMNSDYRAIDADDIAGKAFGATNFCTSIDYLDGFMVKTGADNIYKAWIARNDGSGIRLEVALLQSGAPPPPTTNFVFESYDLIVDFTDTSTGDPSAWDWDFGDGTMSTAQHPRHRYATAGARNACLISSNLGGSGAEVCKNVTVNQVASTVIGVGNGLDMNGDAMVDLTVQSAGGACGSIVNSLTTVNAADFKGVSKDYRDIVAADAQGGGYGSATFCVTVDYLDPFLVRTSTGAVYRAWTAANDGSGIRLEYALLTTVPLTIFANGFEN
ncbi:MAG TPA: PKD domain-containing protein [Xanthomonadaceae bacterium]|nr:PKD domain-containing protein [Xanthomonadaceae bacterium]